jgi:hypothetical protein
MSPKLVETTYGHHHPDHLKLAAAGFRKRKSSHKSGDNGGDGKEPQI